ncbi:MAG: alpha/beta fold hydrolase [Hyphomicrobiaceae bacterium]
MLDADRSSPESVAAASAETGPAAEDIRIAAEDGRLLAASLFAPPGGANPAAPLTIVAGGTGIPRRYYARFAGWLAARGRPVLTFDYRDTGGSRSGPLKDSQVRMRDWCALDVPTVLAWAANAHPGRPLHWVGHSLGGFAVGLAHNNHLIARQLNVGTLSGYWRHMAAPERYRVRLLMGMVAPLIIRARGYFPGVYLGGEDMPGPAFLEWRRWCLSPGFLFDDPTLPEAASFSRFRAPVRFGQVEDDPWGTPAAVAAIAAHFTGSTERSIWPIRLADAGAKRIGHHGFFRAEHRDTLWRAAAEWLDG